MARGKATTPAEDAATTPDTFAHGQEVLYTGQPAKVLKKEDAGYLIAFATQVHAAEEELTAVES